MACEGTDLSSSRPAYTPPSLVSGAGSLKKSLSLSRAKLFCTSLVKGEWKRKKSASLGGEGREEPYYIHHSGQASTVSFDTSSPFRFLLKVEASGFLHAGCLALR